MDKKRKIINLKVLATIVFYSYMTLSLTLYAHSGRTDSNGGHRDVNNVSGLGSYHYHHGYGPHLHPNGICPYRNNTATPTNTVTTTNNNTVIKQQEAAKGEGYQQGIEDGYQEKKEATSFSGNYASSYKEGYQAGYKEGKNKLNAEKEQANSQGLEDGKNNIPNKKQYVNSSVQTAYQAGYTQGLEIFNAHKKQEYEAMAKEDANKFQDSRILDNTLPVEWRQAYQVTYTKTLANLEKSYEDKGYQSFLNKDEEAFKQIKADKAKEWFCQGHDKAKKELLPKIWEYYEMGKKGDPFTISKELKAFENELFQAFQIGKSQYDKEMAISSYMLLFSIAIGIVLFILIRRSSKRKQDSKQTKKT